MLTYEGVSFGQWLKQHRRSLDLTHGSLAQTSSCFCGDTKRATTLGAGIEYDLAHPSLAKGDIISSSK
jgi:hypothetical protein